MENARKFLYILEYIKEQQADKRNNPFMYPASLLDSLAKSASAPDVDKEQLEGTLELFVELIKDFAKNSLEFLARLEKDGLEYYSRKELEEITLKYFEDRFEKPFTDGAGLFD